MSFNDIVVNDYGQLAKITFIDTDTNAAADISGYSASKAMIFIDPSGNSTSVTAAFTTDGTDGLIEYTIASGLIDETGLWQVRGRVTSASATLSTILHEFKVKP